MANQPRSDNPARQVRVEDALWTAAKTAAADNGETVSEVIRCALETYVSDHRIRRVVKIRGTEIY